MSNWWDYPTNYSNTLTNVTNDSVNGVGSFFGSYPVSVIPSVGIGFTVILWIVFFGLSIASGVRKAMMAASFITMILSTYLWRIGLVPLWVIFLLVFLTVVGAIGSKEEQF